MQFRHKGIDYYKNRNNDDIKKRIYELKQKGKILSLEGGKLSIDEKEELERLLKEKIIGYKATN